MGQDSKNTTVGRLARGASGPFGGHHPSAHAARPGRIFSHAELTIHRVRDGDREVVTVCGRLDRAWEFERELRRVGDEALQRMFARSGLLSQLPFVDREMSGRLS